MKRPSLRILIDR